MDQAEKGSGPGSVSKRDPAYYFHALSILVSLHLEEGELEEAEKLLKENQTNTGDFTALWVRLYLKRGQRDQALRALQRQAYKLVYDLRTCLMGLLGEEISPEQDRALEICRILEQIDSLFSVGETWVRAWLRRFICVWESRKKRWYVWSVWQIG